MWKMRFSIRSRGLVLFASAALAMFSLHANAFTVDSKSVHVTGDTDVSGSPQNDSVTITTFTNLSVGIINSNTGKDGETNITADAKVSLLDSIDIHKIFLSDSYSASTSADGPTQESATASVTDDEDVKFTVIDPEEFHFSGFSAGDHAPVISLMKDGVLFLEFQGTPDKDSGILVPGSYELTVTGSVNSSLVGDASQAGSYSVLLTAAVPLPPAAWSAMAGLVVLVPVMARRGKMLRMA